MRELEALRRRLAVLERRVAALEVAERELTGVWLRDGVTAPTAVSGLAVVYVDTSDGDLKVRFGDNFTATLSADS